MIFGSIFGFLSGQGVCVDDTGYIGSASLQSAAIVHDATMWAAVQVAMMGFQRYANGTISDIRRDLANRRMVMAEAALEHAKIAWAKESALVSETMSTPAFTPQYARANIVADYVENNWEYTDTSFDTRTAKLGLTVNQCDDSRTARGMAIAKSDLMGNAMRVAEARALQLNDRRFSRQLAVLGLGRDKLMTAMKIGQFAESGANAVRKAVDTAFNVGMATWGYEENRWRAGQPQQWAQQYSPNTKIAPIEDRTYRFNPYEGMDRTVFVERQPELDSLASSETPPI